jgi:UDP-N-acetylglucosamine diphosphorylase/glucosamine-1-phosphate N-acetyltransferase
LRVDSIAVIVLAAGKGKRMKSKKPKVLHEVGGRPMIIRVLETAESLEANRIVLVVEPHSEDLRRVVDRRFTVDYAVQQSPLGTGHAVHTAIPLVPRDAQSILILYADVPLLKTGTLLRFIDDHVQNERDLTVLAVKREDPRGYGRVIRDESGLVSGIVEEADADDAVKKIRIVNSGIYCSSRKMLEQTLPLIRPDNRQNEYYLTDIVGLGYAAGNRIGVMIEEGSAQFQGVNTQAELETAEQWLQENL